MFGEIIAKLKAECIGNNVAMELIDDLEDLHLVLTIQKNQLEEKINRMVNNSEK